MDASAPNSWKPPNRRARQAEDKTGAGPLRRFFFARIPEFPACGKFSPRCPQFRETCPPGAATSPPNGNFRALRGRMSGVLISSSTATEAGLETRGSPERTAPEEPGPQGQDLSGAAKGKALGPDLRQVPRPTAPSPEYETWRAGQTGGTAPTARAGTRTQRYRRHLGGAGHGSSRTGVGGRGQPSGPPGSRSRQAGSSDHAWMQAQRGGLRTRNATPRGRERPSGRERTRRRKAGSSDLPDGTADGPGLHDPDPEAKADGTGSRVSP